jgi:hypothetical protein
VGFVVGVSYMSAYLIRKAQHLPLDTITINRRHRPIDLGY